MGAVFKRRGGDSLGMGHGFNSAGNELQFCFKKGMIFGTIGPRSRRDQAIIVILADRRLSSGHLEAIPPLKEQRSRLDRAAIAVRSGRDRIVLPPVFAAVRFESDAPDLLRE